MCSATERSRPPWDSKQYLEQAALQSELIWMHPIQRQDGKSMLGAMVARSAHLKQANAGAQVLLLCINQHLDGWRVPGYLPS